MKPSRLCIRLGIYASPKSALRKTPEELRQLHEAGKKHALESAEIINKMQPRHLSLLSLVMEEGTVLWRQWQAGEFVRATPEEVLGEVRTMVENQIVDPLYFTCDHASNYLPLKGTLPDQREEFLHALDTVLSGNGRIRPE